MSGVGVEWPEGAVAFALAPGGAAAYRGKLGCKDIRCTQDGNSERCYGWHCARCDGPSNCQADCRCHRSSEQDEEERND